mmetsp:Transcript_58588/g.155996  ORF Transcript_58588/g.155996 Transcript_58588/m.155996 type:complete len:591 (-) Transcript_58588:99-1871(-)|eukprot:CAMPEP_0194478048 /NCGR_PEP_ID=MMETSP0253-20130528/1647_1 /TAXON_ID=2966 /ORGANISM="Noctiluca scintillans" /LENGTH=590 /DNA_ID=CAMNT_0039317103 /DNA_START=82 /DNA_END=1854 /DNA_ORIENTATION=+
MNALLKSAVKNASKTAKRAQEKLKSKNVDLTFEKGPLGFTYVGPLVTAVEWNGQAAKMDLRLGDQLIAVEGALIPSVETDGEERVQAIIDYWIKEARRPLQLTFKLAKRPEEEGPQSTDEVSAALDSLVSEEADGPEHATLFPWEVDDHAKCEDGSSDASVAQISETGFSAQGRRHREKDVSSSKELAHALAELAASKEQVAILQVDLEVARDNGLCMERELEELRTDGTSEVHEDRSVSAASLRLEARVRELHEQLALSRSECEAARRKTEEHQMALATAQATCLELELAVTNSEEFASEAIDARETVLEDEVARLRTALLAAESHSRQVSQEASERVAVAESHSAHLETTTKEQLRELTAKLTLASNRAELADGGLQRLQDEHLAAMAQARQDHERRVTVLQEQLEVAKTAVPAEPQEQVTLAQVEDHAAAWLVKPSSSYSLDEELGQSALVHADRVLDSTVLALQERTEYLERQCASLQRKLNSRPIVFQAPPVATTSETGLRKFVERHLQRSGPRVTALALQFYDVPQRTMRRATEQLLANDVWLWLFYAHLLALYTIVAFYYAQTTPMSQVGSLNTEVEGVSAPR